MPREGAAQREALLLTVSRTQGNVVLQSGINLSVRVCGLTPRVVIVPRVIVPPVICIRM